MSLDVSVQRFSLSYTKEQVIIIASKDELTHPAEYVSGATTISLSSKYPIMTPTPLQVLCDFVCISDHEFVPFTYSDTVAQS